MDPTTALNPNEKSVEHGKNNGNAAEVQGFSKNIEEILQRVSQVGKRKIIYDLEFECQWFFCFTFTNLKVVNHMSLQFGLLSSLKSLIVYDFEKISKENQVKL